MAEIQESTSSPVVTTDPTKEKPSKVKNIVHLWEKEVRCILEGISLAAHEGKLGAEDQTKQQHAHSPDITDSVLPVARISDRMFCVTCSVKFEDREEQKEHYKSDWHRFNLKRKLKEQAMVSEQEFETITNAGDLSSISGSDSSSDEDSRPGESSQLEEEGREDDEEGGHIEGIGKRHPRVFLRNASGELLSIYRCVIHGKKDQADTAEDLLTMVQQLPSHTNWCILMMAGGHFAAALFDGEKVVEHKTFHRYVVRAKRGTVQSTRDNKGGASKSGGASIRRYNEAALAKEVQDLMMSWSDKLTQCHRIFLRLPTYNKSVFFGGKTPILDKQDSRIRLIPIQTRRPTFKELRRVHDILSAVECYGMESVLDDHISPPRKKPSQQPAKTLPRKPSPSKAAHISNILENFKESSDDADVDVELLTDMVTMDMTELQTFEATKKPNKKKKGKRKPKTEVQSDMSDSPESTEILVLRNDLYTACKMKETEKLRGLLSELTVECAAETRLGRFPGEHIRNETANSHSSIARTEQDSTTSQEPSNHDDHQLSAPNTTCTIPASSQTDDFTNRTSPSFRDESAVVSILNRPFGVSSKTLLMIAAEARHKEALWLLMEAGADPSIKDGQGQLAYHLASSKDVRNEFRRFVAKFPDLYDYSKAQIPAPLSEDQEKARKEREAQRKKAMKKAKKERIKDQKEEEAKMREEEREKQRYLSLSDREKRALAAERRLVAQSSSKGESSPVLSRCFQCGTDITGKVPFEYSDYKFCTTKCLKQHRTQRQTEKSS